MMKTFWSRSMKTADRQRTIRNLAAKNGAAGQLGLFPTSRRAVLSRWMMARVCHEFVTPPLTTKHGGIW